MAFDREVARQVGGALRHLREQRDLTQGMLADLIGISRGKLSTYETGRQIPNLYDVVKLLATLGFSWQEFGRALLSPSEVRPAGGP
ncbi:MAG TPA: helix-turn-helix transcriptional regulator [Thermoanaerobaculia bacterium]|nr:helix-turn-helix transcriptional regulator [Thermoanaerobaculia bacterium]